MCLQLDHHRHNINKNIHILEVLMFMLGVDEIQNPAIVKGKSPQTGPILFVVPWLEYPLVSRISWNRNFNNVQQI